MKTMCQYQMSPQTLVYVLVFFLFGIFDSLSPSVTLFYKDKLLYKPWICDYVGFCVFFFNLVRRVDTWQLRHFEAPAVPSQSQSVASPHTVRLLLLLDGAYHGAMYSQRLGSTTFVSYSIRCVVNEGLFIPVIIRVFFYFCNNVVCLVIISSAC